MLHSVVKIDYEFYETCVCQMEEIQNLFDELLRQNKEIQSYLDMDECWTGLAHDACKEKFAFVSSYATAISEISESLTKVVSEAYADAERFASEEPVVNRIKSI